MNYARIGLLGIKIPIVDDVADAVTSDTFFVILGTALTAGAYGGLAGLLDVTGVEQVVLQEGMKAVAGGAGMIAERQIACRASGAKDCPVEIPGFFEAWAGQVAYRAKKMILIGGPGAVAEALAYAASIIDPAVIGGFQDAWHRTEQAAAYAKDQEAAAWKYLDDQEAICRSAHAGPIDPAFKTFCRKDAIAQATNLANGRTIFDTTDWDIASGDPPPLTTTTLSVKEATDAWLEAVRAAGTPDPDVDPRVAHALSVLNAAKRRDAAIAGKIERSALVRTLGGPSHLPTGVDPVFASPIFNPDTQPSFLGQVFWAGALFSPLWVPKVWPKIKRFL